MIVGCGGGSSSMLRLVAACVRPCASKLKVTIQQQATTVSVPSFVHSLVRSFISDYVIIRIPLCVVVAVQSIYLCIHLLIYRAVCPLGGRSCGCCAPFLLRYLLFLSLSLSLHSLSPSLLSLFLFSHHCASDQIYSAPFSPLIYPSNRIYFISSHLISLHITSLYLTTSDGLSSPLQWRDTRRRALPLCRLSVHCVPQ